MKAVVLAGGLGTRLRPVTYEIPKALVPVKKKPILNHHIEFLTNAGIEEILLVINISEEPDFSRWSKTWSDQAWMPRVRLILEQKRLGTFGALHAVREFLKQEVFILSIGDSLMKFDLHALLQAHQDFNATVTTALVHTTNPIEYGVAVMDGHYIDHFTKDPSEPSSGYISSGLYVVEPRLSDMLGTDEQSLHLDILPLLSARKEYAGLTMPDSRFYECGTLERWEQAIQNW